MIECSQFQILTKLPFLNKNFTYIKSNFQITFSWTSTLLVDPGEQSHNLIISQWQWAFGAQSHCKYNIKWLKMQSQKSRIYYCNSLIWFFHPHISFSSITGLSAGGSSYITVCKSACPGVGRESQATDVPFQEDWWPCFF